MFVQQSTHKTGFIKTVENFLETEQGKDWCVFNGYTNNNRLTILKRK